MIRTQASISTETEFAQAVRIAFDELDWRQLAIIARFTPAQRLAMMFDLCNFVRNLIIASEQQRNPDISDEELMKRFRKRIELSYED